jgi:hypothetical protein
MALPVQPPQPFDGLVTSTIQFGAATAFLASVTESKTVCQSALLAGEKTLVFSGQLSLSLLLETSKQFVHFKSAPALYCPFKVTLSHLQPAGLPVFGVVEMPANQQPLVVGFFAQNSSTGIFSLHAKHVAIWSLQQTLQGGFVVVVVFTTLALASWQ